MFKQWSLPLKILFLPNLLERENVIEFLHIAGVQIGLGDWRPKYGRFIVKG